jgi:hypothetical protein
MSTQDKMRQGACAAVVAITGFAPAVAIGQGSPVAAPAMPESFVWSTVANSATVIPGGDGRTFNSFNQPSVNGVGIVVIRAQGKGAAGSGEPLRGIYVRRISGTPGTVTPAFDSLTEVPQPNNTQTNGALATFNEFPSFPRIGRDSLTLATRGQSTPVWTYTLPDGTETRTGTAGVYAYRLGQRVTAMSQLGAVPGFEHFAVPGAAPGTKFDQFPGSPAIAGATTVVVKGNYSDAGVPKTGIFFRDFTATAPTQRIASSDTVIPGPNPLGTTFGSTAPPSASATDVVFVGLDNEESPTMGGVYRAPLAPSPALETLVAIGGPVPGEASGVSFGSLGEGLTFDGRYVGFWGAWGTDTRPVTLVCPTDGNKDVIAACLEQYPSGSTVVQVPVNQGFFVHDLQARRSWRAARTGSGGYIDFVYWHFSGRPPGAGGDEGGDDFEGPRWRSGSFVAVNGHGNFAQVVFKGRKSEMPTIDGVYATIVPMAVGAPKVVLETGMAGNLVDPQAPAGAAVTTLGIERDGLRGAWIVVSAGMLDEITGESWAGIYLTRSIR